MHAPAVAGAGALAIAAATKPADLGTKLCDAEVPDAGAATGAAVTVV